MLDLSQEIVRKTLRAIIILCHFSKRIKMPINMKTRNCMELDPSLLFTPDLDFMAHQACFNP